MNQKCELKVTSDYDVDKINTKDYLNFDHVHVDLSKTELDANRFYEIFDRLCETKQSRKFHLDLINVDLDEAKVNRIIKCFENWPDVTILHLHFSDIKISNEDFEKLMTQGIAKMQNITKVHLVMQNIKFNKNKRISIESLIKSLPKLNDIKINLQNNNLKKEDIDSLKQIIKDKKVNELIWE